MSFARFFRQFHRKKSVPTQPQGPARHQPFSEEELKALLEHRSRFVTLSADIAGELGKFSITVALENAKNVRNLLVVAGALASLGLLLLSNEAFGAGPLLVLTVITYLISIAAGAAYLIWDTSKAARQVANMRKDYFEIPDEGQRIVNDWEDRKIQQDEAERQLNALYRKMHFEKVRPPKKEAAKDSYASQLVHGLFVIATLLLAAELTRLLLPYLP